MRVGWDGQPVVHPLALPPGGDDARLPQIGQMPGNLGLGRADDFGEIADAYFLLGHEIEKPQAGRIAERSKKLVERRILFRACRHG